MTVPLVVLCASHIDAPERALLLKAHIQSIAEQSHPVRMFVSVSGKLPIDLRADGEKLTVFAHGAERKLSQFEHYEHLVEQLAALMPPGAFERTFCVFCDDDDYSHPSRCAFYAAAPDQGQHSMLATDAVLLLADDRVVNGHEYFMFALRAPKLRAFCGVLRARGLLGSPVCDILLGSLLVHSTKLWRPPQPAAPWLYAYNNKLRDREPEIEAYRRMLLDDDLMRELEAEFGIREWTRGMTTIYGKGFRA
jgi:hypothetical protein